MHVGQRWGNRFILGCSSDKIFLESRHSSLKAEENFQRVTHVAVLARPGLGIAELEQLVT
jgi:hypothetical protein